MSLFAVVPVKPLDEGKSRLAGHLDQPGRRALNAHFLKRTLALLSQFCGPGRTIVVSRDKEVLQAAAALEMVALNEPGEADLNFALATGTTAARERGASALLVLPVDLPLATLEVLRAICAGDQPVIVLVPDRHGAGTNVLFQRPVMLRRYRFGPDSLARHQAIAEGAGCPVKILSAPALALDIDTPADLAAWGGAASCPAA
ncbi:2-phospho-L-lactate guanylyltransferase [Aquabacter sp. CN5-332]|uniref:2-phospho-L-lactate guanylyltransferase n=1 Tax=Aquabacter sp. CN5-332 TaxID=3156608 RepID=UPI0032B5B40D